MILVDYSGVAISAITVHMGTEKENRIDTIELARESILNSLRGIARKFKSEYGEMVICVDDKTSWRSTHFPYYKENRKKLKEESLINWGKVYLNMYSVLKEIKENFHYRIVRYDTAEADDVMAVLALNIDGSHVVVSKDKDMVQLTSNQNIKVYSPLNEGNFMSQENLDYYIFKHIVKGDTGDGITNILSDDDTIITPGKRQKPVTEKNLMKWYVDRKEFMELYGEKFERNKKIISLFEIPEDISLGILEKFNSQEIGNKKKILQYLIKHDLNDHINRVGDF
jgi:hypothetical protein